MLMKISEWLDENSFYDEYDREEVRPLLKQYKVEELIEKLLRAQREKTFWEASELFGFDLPDEDNIEKLTIITEIDE